MQESQKKPLISVLGLIGIALWGIAFIVLLQLLNSFQLRAPIPGSRIPLGAALNMAAQVIMFLALLLGWRFARIKDYTKHARVQTTVVLVNLLMIFFIMGVTFFGPEVLENPAGTSDRLIMIEISHGILGSLAALSGTYLVFRMTFERVLPQWIMVANFKRVMQITIVLWLLISVGGFAIFGMKYLAPPPPRPPVATPSPTTTPLPTETPVPTQPPPTPSPTPGEVTGIAAMVDAQAINDGLNIDLFNIPPAPAGSQYEAWLIGNNGEFRLSVGVLSVEANGRISEEYVSPIGENLFANYDSFLLTLESDDDPEPSADIRFSVVIPPQARSALNELFVAGRDTPAGVGYLVGLRQQAYIVQNHLSLSDLESDVDNLSGIRRHAEHLVNALQGLHGANFGDVDGDGRVLNPGDGYGILSPVNAADGLGYIDQVIASASAAMEAEDATEQIQFHAGHVVISANNTKVIAQELSTLATELAQASDLDQAHALLDELVPLADQLLNGVDIDGDGSVQPVPGEGAIQTAYEHAQFASSPAYEAALLEGGAPIVVPEATPTPTPPPPTPIPTPDVPQLVQVLMQDFAFAGQTISIVAGTTVEFINLDNAPHTATLDDESLDTGTMNLNDVASLTFDTPGTFSYFCLFHGGPGGVGMAAVIEVTP